MIDYEIIGLKYGGKVTIVRECESFADAYLYAEKTFGDSIVSVGINDFDHSKYE